MTNTDKVKVLNEATETIINDMAETLRPIVDGIETSIKVTQNHYGRYLAILTQFEDKDMKLIVAKALIIAGANRQGITSALRLT